MWNPSSSEPIFLTAYFYPWITIDFGQGHTYGQKQFSTEYSSKLQ